MTFVCVFVCGSFDFRGCFENGCFLCCFGFWVLLKKAVGKSLCLVQPPLWLEMNIVCFKGLLSKTNISDPWTMEEASKELLQKSFQDQVSQFDNSCQFLTTSMKCHVSGNNLQHVSPGDPPAAFSRTLPIARGQPWLYQQSAQWSETWVCLLDRWEAVIYSMPMHWMPWAPPKAFNAPSALFLQNLQFFLHNEFFGKHWKMCIICMFWPPISRKLLFYQNLE